MPASDDPSCDRLAALAAGLRSSARARNHRCALVLAGESPWCRQAVAAVLHGAGVEDPLWITDRPPRGARSVCAARAQTMLGKEIDTAIIDAYAGFDADAFGAVSGSIRGGGLLLLLTPPLTDWPGFNDPEHARLAVAPYCAAAIKGRFLRRLVRVLREQTDLVVCRQGGEVPTAARPPKAAAPVATTDPIYRTLDQREAVAAVVKVARGHRRRPLVLMSDRGRGKSAALGIAAAQLLQQGLRCIVVTAARRDAVEPLFEQAKQHLPQVLGTRGTLIWGETRIEYAPPDALTLNPRAADLLLVDEAAAIPTPLLERLLGHYARIVFATTVHGYEGSGRGFAVRFQQVLGRRTPGHRVLRLRDPVRWAVDDPVERLTFDALLLDASPTADDAVREATVESCTIEQLDRDALTEDETTLAELFGLLVLAHYRTSPMDLRHLLDGPNLSVYAMRHRRQVVATALVAAEGGFDAATARAIWEGRRRPRGHLIPQSLAAHIGLEHAAMRSCARVIRIAVHPAAQSRGLGSRLLRHIVEHARAANLDCVGSSFGASVELLRFWGRANFEPVRLGVTRGAASGMHSVIVLQPLSDIGAAIFDQARQHFGEHLPHLLSDPLRELDPELAAAVLQRSGPTGPPRLGTQDWRNLMAFAFALRGYDVTLAPLWTLVCAALSDDVCARRLRPTQRDALIAKVLQKRSWQDVAHLIGVPGKARVTEVLRQAVRPMVLHFGDDQLKQEAQLYRDPERRESD